METKYVSAHTKMQYKCNKNHINYIRFYSFQQGKGCKQCYLLNKFGKNNPNWNPDREYIKLNNKIRSLCSTLLSRSLKSLNKPKNDHTYKLLGFHPKDLQNHLELYSNWNILKEQDWHLDHRMPIKAFIEHNITDLKIINHLSNLQPLEYKTNLKKNCRYRKKDFHKYMEQFSEWKYDKNTYKYILIESKIND